VIPAARVIATNETLRWAASRCRGNGTTFSATLNLVCSATDYFGRGRLPIAASVCYSLRAHRRGVRYYDTAVGFCCPTPVYCATMRTSAPQTYSLGINIRYNKKKKFCKTYRARVCRALGPLLELNTSYSARWWQRRTQRRRCLVYVLAPATPAGGDSAQCFTHTLTAAGFACRSLASHLRALGVYLQRRASGDGGALREFRGCSRLIMCAARVLTPPLLRGFKLYVRFAAAFVHLQLRCTDMPTLARTVFEQRSTAIMPSNLLSAVTNSFHSSWRGFKWENVPPWLYPL